MTSTTLASKIPVLDYADPTKFKFQCIKIPKVEFNTVGCNLPGISLTELTQPTRLQQLKIPGNDITFEDLTITFIVDENLETYKDIHNWIAALSQTDSDDKFRELVTDGGDRMPLSTQTRLTDAGRVTKATPDGAIFSDAKLIVLSARNIPIIEVTFKDIYPKALSALEYNQNLTDVEYLTATCTFGYKSHSYSNI
tara:strand:- start:1370 stop:1957 length:588 start_codon:yes stop_codon:yes gene_type:complete